MAALLEVTDLTKHFGTVHAVESASLSVDANTITGMIGPNGSGKTTLFNLVTGYLRPDGGRVTFRGRDVTGANPGTLYRRGLSRTFQQARIFPELTVRENLTAAVGYSWGQLFGRRFSRADREGIELMLEDFRMSHVADLYGSELSYGQRKLLEFAAVLMSSPTLVLLDEPTSGVNAVMIETMEHHIRQRHAAGVTFLIVEHDMGFVMRLCSSVVVIDQGRRIFAGSPEQVQSNPLVLDAYLGADVETLLTLEGVVAGYGAGDILKGVSLEVASGAVTCLIGPNGAGKSTVLKAISGLIRPRVGTVCFNGDVINGLSPRARLLLGIVHVPQERSLFPAMTVRDNLLMGGYIMADQKAVLARMDEAADVFPICRLRARDHAGSLSGGEQKQVELARTLVLDPHLILLDEPSIGLDPKSRAQVFQSIRQLAESGRTVLLVEQNARSGLATAEFGAVLEGGVVRLVATGKALLADPEVARLYLGGTTATAVRAEHAPASDRTDR